MSLEPGNTLVPGDAGTFIEINDLGVPQGVWSRDDSGNWTFVEIADTGVPLGVITVPKTGDSNYLVIWLAAMLTLSGLTSVYLIISRSRKKNW